VAQEPRRKPIGIGITLERLYLRILKKGEDRDGFLRKNDGSTKDPEGRAKKKIQRKGRKGAENKKVWVKPGGLFRPGPPVVPST